MEYGLASPSSLPESAIFSGIFWTKNRLRDAKRTRAIDFSFLLLGPSATTYSSLLSAQVQLRPDDQGRVRALVRLAVLQVPVSQASRLLFRLGGEELPGQPR